MKRLLSSSAGTRPFLPSLWSAAAADSRVLGYRAPEHRGAARRPRGPSATAVSLSQQEPASHRLRCCAPVYALAQTASILLSPRAPPGPGGIGDGPGSVPAASESRCGQHGQPPPPYAGPYGQGASGPASAGPAGPGAGGSGGAAVPVGPTPVRSVTATSQEQDSNSNPPAGTPQTPPRAKTSGALSCSLDDSTSVSLTDACV